MFTAPHIEVSPNRRLATIFAPSSYGTRMLVERFGRDQAGNRRPVMIVRTSARPSAALGFNRAA